MADTFVFHKTTRRYQKREKILNRVLWTVIIILFCLAAAKIIFQFFITPARKITNITVESDLTISKDDILALAGIEKNKYYLEQDLKKVKQNLEAIPQVREAVVEKIFPSTIRIALTAHKPVAISLANVNDKNLPVAFDENGSVILVGREITSWNLPVISGLKFNTLEAGTRLPRQLFSFLKEIAVLKNDFSQLYDLISEVKVEPVSTLDYELLLYFVPYRIPVRIGNKLSGEQLSYALMVLDVLAREKADKRIKELDFRTNEVVYKEEGVIN